jgi:hypothetical protein
LVLHVVQTWLAQVPLQHSLNAWQAVPPGLQLPPPPLPLEELLPAPTPVDVLPAPPVPAPEPELLLVGPGPLVGPFPLPVVQSPPSPPVPPRPVLVCLPQDDATATIAAKKMAKNEPTRLMRVPRA